MNNFCKLKKRKKGTLEDIFEIESSIYSSHYFILIFYILKDTTNEIIRLKYILLR